MRNYGRNVEFHDLFTFFFLLTFISPGSSFYLIFPKYRVSDYKYFKYLYSIFYTLNIMWSMIRFLRQISKKYSLFMFVTLKCYGFSIIQYLYGCILYHLFLRNVTFILLCIFKKIIKCQIIRIFSDTFLWG